MSDPSTVTGLIHRWRAASIAQSNATAVSSWAALTGSIALTQATGTNQPTYIVSGFGSQPVVRFDGSTSYLLTTGMSSQAQPLTVVTIMKWNSVATTQQVFDCASALEVITLAGSPSQWDGFAGVDLLSGAGNPTQTTSAIVLGYIANNTSSALWLNGTNIVTGASGTNTLSTDWNVGRLSTGSRFASMDLAEILIYSRALTSGDMSVIDSYSQDLYGITVADYVSSAGPSHLGLTSRVTRFRASTF